MATEGTPARITLHLQDLMQRAVEAGASDLHLVSGYAPTIRLNGELVRLTDTAIDEAALNSALLPLLNDDGRNQFVAEKNFDFAVQFDRDGTKQRFRANYFLSGSRLGACFRVIPATIPDFEWAGFPRELGARLGHFRDGLVLICGVTGSGKTTTLAMIINLLIQEGGYRIITVEEPIEFVFPNRDDSVVTQREVGLDVRTFSDGLKYGLRQDPDVILVGEIRDRDTAQMALSAAETGHLVLATMHTRDAKGAISRYADLFPQNVQPEIRAQLAAGLRAVISQHLLPSIVPGAKRELALEIMFNNVPNASAIRFAKLDSIDNNVVTGRAEGMLSITESVKRLLHAGKISRETAAFYAPDVDTRPSAVKRPPRPAHYDE